MIIKTRTGCTKTVVMLLAGIAIAGAGTPSAVDQDGLFEPPVRLMATDGFIDTDIGHAAPFVYDYDGDGVDDLLVGQFGRGRLRIYRNTGTNAEPVYAAHEWFKAGHEYGTVPAG